MPCQPRVVQLAAPCVASVKAGAASIWTIVLDEVIGAFDHLNGELRIRFWLAYVGFHRQVPS